MSDEKLPTLAELSEFQEVVATGYSSDELAAYRYSGAFVSRSVDADGRPLIEVIKQTYDGTEQRTEV